MATVTLLQPTDMSALPTSIAGFTPVAGGDGNTDELDGYGGTPWQGSAAMQGSFFTMYPDAAGTVNTALIDNGDNGTFPNIQITNADFDLSLGFYVSDFQPGNLYALVAGIMGGDDTITASTGVDTLLGFGGNDRFLMGANLTVADRIDGGAGNNTVVLDGDYSAHLFFGEFTLTNIQTLSFAAGHDYNIETVDGTVAAGATFTVDASALGPADTLTFVGDGETDGKFIFLFKAANLTAADTVIGGSGTGPVDQLRFTTSGAVAAGAFANVQHIEQIVLANGANNIALSDALVGSSDNNHTVQVFGGSGADTISAAAVTTAANKVYLYAGTGNDALTGGAGADTFVFAAADLNSSDSVTGGTGASFDRLYLTTAGAISTAFNSMAHIETVQLANGTNTVFLPDAFVTSADDGHVVTVIGGTGADTVSAIHVTTATNSVRFLGGGGADVLTASAGHDTFIYNAVSESTGNATGTAYDTLAAFNAAADHIDLPGAPGITAVNAVNAGNLSSATFDTDLHNAIDGSLGAHQAVLFDPASGTLGSHLFLIVNPTGAAGYVSGADYVFDVTGHAGAFTTGTFI